MQLASTQFHYTPASRTYVAEASELRVGRPGQHITIDGFAFVFAGADMDASGEDIQGWNYKPTMNSVELNSALQGVVVLIIND